MMISSALRSLMKHLGSRQILSTLVMLASMLVLSGCGDNRSWTQKTVIVVDTPSGPISGSATVLVKWRSSLQVLPDALKWHYSYEGEASIVDLGKGMYLFALINDAERLGLKLFGNDLYTQSTNGLGPAIKHTAKSDGQEKPIPPKIMPLLVTFDDINDPSSVKQVNPNDLAASFGAGYSLKSMTLEITDEKVTDGEVEMVLGWLNEYKSKYYRLNGEKCTACPIKSQNLSDLLSGSDFKVGK